MAAPTNITVVTDKSEYSRYEVGKEVIHAYVSVAGGAPYSDQLLVELVKARRSRDVVVASQTVQLTSAFDPANLAVEFDLRNIVDHNLINLVRHGKYFIRASYLATSASAVIGGGAVLVTAVEGSYGNDFTIEVVVPLGTQPLTVRQGLTPNDIVVELATANGVALGFENSAAFVAAAINSFGYGVYNPRVNAVALTSTVLNSAEPPQQFSGGHDEVSGYSSDFNVRIVTVARLKSDWLFGIDLRSTKVLQASFMGSQGQSGIPGVEIIEVSADHPTGLYSLAYNYEDNSTAASSVIGAGADGSVHVTAANPVVGETGNQLSIEVVDPGVAGPLGVALTGATITVTLAHDGTAPDPAANTATAIADALNFIQGPFVALATGDGTGAITAPESHQFAGGVTDVVRTLAWGTGPAISITGPGIYILPRTSPTLGGAQAGAAGCGSGGLGSRDYIKVRVGLLSQLPTHPMTADILIESAVISDDTLGRYIDEALGYIEENLLHTYLEPTTVTTDRDPTMIQFASSFNAPTPIFTDPDYDFITTPLTYFVPKNTGTWISIQTPFMSVLRVDSLFGQIANTRVIDIDLEWIEISEHGGFLQLVPYNQETAFNFMGIVWINALRGAMELPNFWHYTMIAGLRDCPPELQELLGKYAAIQALTAAALAFRPGLGSMSLSRDGVSQSTSYLNQQKYGIYTGTIQSYKDWMEEAIKKFKARYRGAMLTVV